MKNKSNLEIALIQPDSPFLFEPLAFPSLGLMYVSSYLKQNGYSPKFYDLTGGVKLPENLRADIFGFSSQITQFKDVVDLKNKLKETNPTSLFVIGGPFPTHSPKDCLDAGFDVVVRGEGEIPMLKIAQEYPNIKDTEMYSKEAIDPNFFPDWESIDTSRYKFQLDGKKCMNIMTRRGNCPYNCTFCAKPEIGKSPLRFRSVKNVLDEVKYLRDEHEIEAIAFYDDDVLIKKDRDKEIFKGLQELGMSYRCMTRANLATREDLKFLKDTGCIEVCVGIETGDPNMLENTIKKGTTIEQNTEFLQNCRDIGLNVKAYMIIGLPGESRITIQNTKDWMKEVKMDNYELFTFTPYPGSDIYKNKEMYEIDWDEKVLRDVWFTGAGQYGNCIVHTPYLSSKEILKAKEDIEKEFPRSLNKYWGVKE